MYTQDDTFEYVRPRLVDLIAHQKARCGCAMEAVKNVAKRVGAHEGWVRRIVGRYGEAKIQAHQFLNVMREHVRVKGAERAKNKAAKRGPKKFWTFPSHPIA